MQINVGRPKDLEKKKSILNAAKQLFLMHGYDGSSMNEIAKLAGVTKLTVYNHFQDKATLFTCAIEETCEALIQSMPLILEPSSDFKSSLAEACQISMNIANLPEAIKLDLLMMELSAQNNPLVVQFFNASHGQLNQMWSHFLACAQKLGFIQDSDIEQQIEILSSLLFGLRHQKILLGLSTSPSAEQQQQIIENAIELFLYKYKKTV